MVSSPLVPVVTPTNGFSRFFYKHITELSFKTYFTFQQKLNHVQLFKQRSKVMCLNDALILDLGCFRQAQNENFPLFNKVSLNFKVFLLNIKLSC